MQLNLTLKPCPTGRAYWICSRILRSILFPGYFKPSQNGLDVACKLEHLGVIYWRLAGQIHKGLCTRLFTGL